MPTPLFTIGYESHRTPDSLVAALCKAGIRRVVDVRELPLSRRRGFSKTALSSSLAKSYMKYEHVRELGNPKPYRDLYKGGNVGDGRRRYRSHLHNGSYPSLLELASSIGDELTCLLCFEDDHTTCHRDVIVEALLEVQPDLEVIHL